MQSAYSKNVDTDETGRACTTAAPSKTLTSYDSGGGGDSLFTHAIKSDFFPNRSCPNSDKDGGYG